jgi:hypothetical protein
MAKDKLKIFMSYAPEDEAMKTELDKALVALKRNEKIEVWQDRQLLAGQEEDKAINDELLASDIILLLISIDYLNSKDIWDKQITVAMQRHDKKEARVIPVILRPCDWQEMPFGKLQALPPGDDPVTKMTDRDEAYTEIAKGIRHVVEFMLNN